MQIPAPENTIFHTNVVMGAGVQALSKRMEKYKIPIISENLGYRHYGDSRGFAFISY